MAEKQVVILVFKTWHGPFPNREAAIAYKNANLDPVADWVIEELNPPVVKDDEYRRVSLPLKFDEGSLQAINAFVKQNLDMDKNWDRPFDLDLDPPSDEEILEFCTNAVDNYVENYYDQVSEIEEIYNKKGA